ncbi:hypothetical protein [Shumkonia mesophila]|nr:hypothetical protein [Shumkonia mesophila]
MRSTSDAKRARPMVQWLATGGAGLEAGRSIIRACPLFGPMA